MYLLYDDDYSALSINLILFLCSQALHLPAVLLSGFPVFLFSYFPIVLFLHFAAREKMVLYNFIYIDIYRIITI